MQDQHSKVYTLVYPLVNLYFNYANIDVMEVTRVTFPVDRIWCNAGQPHGNCGTHGRDGHQNPQIVDNNVLHGQLDVVDKTSHNSGTENSGLNLPPTV